MGNRNTLHGSSPEREMRLDQLPDKSDDWLVAECRQGIPAVLEASRHLFATSGILVTRIDR
jgi:hypothetical protein